MPGISPTIIHIHVDVVKILLANRADVNANDNDGQTLLHNSRYNGLLNVIELLIEHGVNAHSSEALKCILHR